MKINDFQQIPQLTRSSNYQVNVNWKYLENWIKRQEEDMNLNLTPIFQRGHVWTEEQQIAYIEYILRGGHSSKVVYFNSPSWRVDVKPGSYNDFVCVDGLQRITAVRRFMNNEIPAFGTLYKDFTGRLPTDADLIINVNDLQSEQEVLQWYIDLNVGGTPHTEDEINRVKNLMRGTTRAADSVASDIKLGDVIYYIHNQGHTVDRCIVIGIDGCETNRWERIHINNPDNIPYVIDLVELDDTLFFDKDKAKKRALEIMESYDDD